MKNVFKSICTILLLSTSVGVMAQVPKLSSYPAASAVIYLDFDGHTVDGTSWNTNGPIVAGGANMNSAQITEVYNRVSEDYRPFSINITTDSTKYLAAPATQRMRVIMTVTSSWYGNAGGVAFVNSFSWGDNTPAFVFTALHNYNVKNISEAASHEAGHTLGLRHQSAYDGNCVKTSEYNSGIGSGEISWAPIMGVGYNRNQTLWNNGANPFGCTSIQDDLGIITSSNNGITYRYDDHSNITTGATIATFTNNAFTVEGIVERNNDVDIIKFTTPANGRFRMDAIPFSVATGNVGSNLDIQIDLLDAQQIVLRTFNPANTLSVVIDTTLNPGLFYLRLRGVGNVYAPNYASLGSYTISATFSANSALPVHKLELTGAAERNHHRLNWDIIADENITEQTLEVSTDGRIFKAAKQLATGARNTDYVPDATGSLYYRLNVHFDDGKQYYSNVVTLRNDVAPTAKPFMVGNMIRSNIAVNSPAPFAYTVYDFNGRTMARGNLFQGMNNIPAGSLARGLYIIQYHDGRDQHTEKFMKQ